MVLEKEVLGELEKLALRGEEERGEGSAGMEGRLLWVF